MERPPSFGSWLAPGASLTRVVKSRPLGSRSIVSCRRLNTRALWRVSTSGEEADTRTSSTTPAISSTNASRLTCPRRTSTPSNLSGGESGQGSRDVVVARGERGKAERAGRVGGRRDCRALREVQRGDRGAWEHRLLGVLHRAFNRSTLLLCGCRLRQQERDSGRRGENQAHGLLSALTPLTQAPCATMSVARLVITARPSRQTQRSVPRDIASVFPSRDHR